MLYAQVALIELLEKNDVKLSQIFEAIDTSDDNMITEGEFVDGLVGLQRLWSVCVPPVTGAGRRAARAENALVHAVEPMLAPTLLIRVHQTDQSEILKLQHLLSDSIY